MLSVIEKVALTTLVLGVPLENVELRVINSLGGLKWPVKSSEGGSMISSLRISVVHGTESVNAQGAGLGSRIRSI